MANQGYFAGGGGTTDTTVDKMIFSTEITSSITSATLSVSGRSYGSTASNNTGGWGYFAGGQDGDSDPLSSIDKITFSNDTIAAATSGLSLGRWSTAGNSDNTNGKGYFSGGKSGGGILSTVDKIIFSNDSVSAVSSLPANEDDQTGVSSDAYGWGYSIGSIYDSVKITYSTDASTTVTTANLSVSRRSPAGVSDNTNGKGYLSGGDTGTSGYVTTTDKLTYSNSTSAAQTTANLSQARAYAAGISNNPSGKGYVSGGQTPTVTTTDKITFSTDATVALTSGNLSKGRTRLFGLSGNDAGGGGGVILGGDVSLKFGFAIGV